MTLSFCFILKKGYKNMFKSLKDASLIADEILVADFSKDNIQNIMQSNTGLADDALVYGFDPSIDYSFAIDYLSKSASGDWILLLFGDEDLSVPNPDEVKKELENTDAEAFSVRIVHLLGRAPHSPIRAFKTYSPRLFRKGQNFRFCGKTPEMLGCNISENRPQVMKDITIKNHAFTFEGIEPSCADILSENGSMFCCKAFESFCAGEYDKALSLLNQAEKNYKEKGEKPPAVLYKLRFETMLNMGEIAKVYKEIRNAIRLYPDYVDLHFYKALSLFANNRFKEAAEGFSYCLLLGEGNKDYIISCGYGACLALYFLGISYTKMGEEKHFEELFNQASRVCPDPKALEAEARKIPGIKLQQ